MLTKSTAWRGRVVQLAVLTIIAAVIFIAEDDSMLKNLTVDGTDRSKAGAAEGARRYSSAAVGVAGDDGRPQAATVHHKESQSTASQPSSKSDYCIQPLPLAKAETAFQHCKSANHVLDKKDSHSLQLHQMPSNARHFSLQHLPHSSGDADEDQTSRKQCATSNAILRSLKHGRRRWEAACTHESAAANSSDPACSDEALEKQPSWFVPANHCEMDFAMHHHRMRSIVTRFSNVVIIGDSLARHIMLGFHIHLSSDVQTAGNHIFDPRLTDHLETKPSEVCQCDGLFSEHAFCRKYGKDMYDFVVSQQIDTHGNDSQEEPVHDTAAPSSTSVHYQSSAYNGGAKRFKAQYDFNDIQCSSEDTRPILLVLQGGMHFAVRASATFRFFQPVWHHPKLVKCSRKFIVLWMSMSSQSTSLDEAYPHQDRRHRLLFNQQFPKLLDSAVQNATVMDWMNLTTRAQTSDGVHFLMDVNYVKVLYILRAAEALLQEGHFATFVNQKRAAD